MTDGIFLADSPVPTIDAGWFVLMLTRVLHTASAAVLLGGLVYLKKVVAPLAEGADDTAEALYCGRRSAWAGLVMLTSTLLILSGIYNFYHNVNVYDLPPAYHMLVGIKMLLALFVFFVAASTAGKSPAAIKMQKNIQKWLTTGIVAALLVFVLGAAARTFPKEPKPIEDVPAVQPMADGDNGQES